MAIVKVTYTKNKGGAKATIRYIQHRPGSGNARMNRILFGIDGAIGRWQAYRMVEEAQQGSVFFRIVISPDPSGEDSRKDLHLRAVTEHTMQTLEDRIQQQISWVGVEHTDHAPHRHVHVVAILSGRLQGADLAALRQAATQACGEQRRHLDQTQGQQGKEPGWEHSR